MLAPLQGVLHAVAQNRLVLKLCDLITSAVQELYWLPVVERREYKLCFLIHKKFIGHVPEYWLRLLTPGTDVPAQSALC